MHSFDDEFAIKNAKALAPPTTQRAAPVDARDTHAKSAAGLLKLQRSVGNAGVAQLMEGDEDRQSIDSATRSGGQPLDSSSRVQMESAFGADLSSVRVHTGGDADASARQLGAHAYTVGEDVVFANGRYEPETPTGQRTLAHELTHVVQQRSGPVDGTDTGGGVKVSHPSDSYEQAAESKADQVVAGRMADSTNIAGAASGGQSSVQREGEEEEEVQTLAVQREEEQEEEVQTLAVQREGEEEEEVQTLAVQREGEGEQEEEEQAMS